jgi:hypothetical protein
VRFCRFGRSSGNFRRRFQEVMREENHMRGSIRKRYKDSWSIILDMGYQIVPETGKMKRVQKWFTVQGTKRDAERKLTELLHHLHRGEYVEPSKSRFRLTEPLAQTTPDQCRHRLPTHFCNAERPSSPAGPLQVHGVARYQ